MALTSRAPASKFKGAQKGPCFDFPSIRRLFLLLPVQGHRGLFGPNPEIQPGQVYQSMARLHTHTHKQPHTHTLALTPVDNESQMSLTHDCALWEEAGVLGENPHKHREKPGQRLDREPPRHRAHYGAVNYQPHKEQCNEEKSAGMQNVESHGDRGN